MSVEIDDIRDKLRTVQEPELHRDIVSLNMVRDIRLQGDEVKITVELTTPACPLKDELRARVEHAVRQLPSIKNVQVDFTARVAQTRPVSGKQPLDGVKNIIAIYACKGGVGKSTVATNLAVALAQSGAQVGLLDADVHGPNIPRMMGVHEKPSVSAENKITPLDAHGVKLMSLGLFRDANIPVIWRGPMVHGAVQQLLRDTLWGQLDYLLVDLPPGTGDAQLTLVQSVPLAGVVFVSTPQMVSLDDGIKGISMFRKLRVPLLGLVENMSGFTCPHCEHVTDIFSKGGAAAEAEATGIPFLGTVPIDPAIVVGGDQGHPVVCQAGSPSARIFIGIAQKVAANLSVQQYDAQSLEPSVV